MNTLSGRSLLTILTVAIVGCEATHQEAVQVEVETRTPDPIATPAPKEPKPVVIACPKGETITVRVHPDMPDSVFQSAQSAFSLWQVTLSDKVTFEVVRSPDAKPKYRSCNIYVVWNEDDDEFGSFALRRNPDGTTASGVLFVHRKLFKPDDLEGIYATVLHESGHLVGLDHDTSREHKTLMWPFITVPGRIGCEDVRRACGTWGCSAKCEGNGWLE